MASGESPFAGSPWPGLVLMFVSGPLFGGLGLALARNFRGFTEWHVRQTFKMTQPAERFFRRVPPWSRLLKRPVEDRIAAQIKHERLTGFVFVALGSLMIVGGGVAFVAWLL